MTELRRALGGAWYPLEDEEPGDASVRSFYGVHADQVWQLCASTTRKAWVAHTVVDVLDGLDSITSIIHWFHRRFQLPRRTVQNPLSQRRL